MTQIFLQATGGGLFGGGNQMMFIMLAMFAVFYFFMIRPQQKKQKEQVKFLEELKKGQKVVTLGGMHGKIVQLNNDNTTLLLEVSEGTKIKIDKNVVSMEYSLLANKSSEESNS